ncbi:MAG: acetyl-CoA carboxylase biotin carboxyl carrier protein [Candidatus Omnitrophota bacterium]
MNLKEIKEMIALMNENDLTELELERDGLKIRLKKSGGEIQQFITHPQAAAQYKEAAQAPAPQPPDSHLIEVKSPMVGTFYRAASPESAAFVDTGSEIQPEQVVCIIEAMKLMNEIKSEVKGIVREILVENGHPVEYGQVLFRVEPL